MHVHRFGQRLQCGAEDDDAGMASRKQPTTRKAEGDEEPHPGGPIPQAVTFSSSKPRHLIVGEQPAEHGGRAYAKQCDRRQSAGFGERVVQMRQIHFAIDEDGQDGGVDHRDGGRLGGREPAQQDAADDDDGREQRRRWTGSRESGTLSASRAGRPDTCRAWRRRARWPSGRRRSAGRAGCRRGRGRRSKWK